MTEYIRFLVIVVLLSAYFFFLSLRLDHIESMLKAGTDSITTPCRSESK